MPIIIVPGALEVRQQMAALQRPCRAHYCLPKPVDVHVLRSTVETALKECSQTEIIWQFEALERSCRADTEELLSRFTDRLAQQNHIVEQLKKQKASGYFRACLGIQGCPVAQSSATCRN